MKPFIRRFHGKFYFVPLGCFLLDFFLSLLSWQLSHPHLRRISIYSLSAGVITGWFSFATGIVSVFLLRKNAMASGLGAIHGFVGGLAMMIFTVLWLGPWHALPEVPRATVVGTIFKAVSLGLLIAAVIMSRRYLRPHLKTGVDQDVSVTG